MPASIWDVYRQYLGRMISLDELRDWLALHQWNLSDEDEDLADEADVALAHLDDGYGDEDDLRFRLSSTFERRTSTFVMADLVVSHAVLPLISWHETTSERESTAKNKKVRTLTLVA